MNKTRKLNSIIFIVFCFILLFTVGCSNKSGIKGELSYESKRNELEVTADFEENAKLSESTTKVSIRLYDKDENYKSVQSASVVNNISATVTFSSLEQNTFYVLKLFVSVDGYEEELDSITASTKNDGTSEDTAVPITTVAEFKNMANDRDAYYKLEADLDFTDSSELSIFTSESTAFIGNFDGNGHTISNVVLSAKTYSGIFGYAIDATIKNLNLKNISLKVTTSVRQAGALVGLMRSSTVENVNLDQFTLDTSTTTSTSDLNIGSLVGLTDTSATINNCKATNLTMDITRIRTTKTFAYGLLVGNLTGEATVTNSSAQGTMNLGLYANGTNYVGGFIGIVSSTGKIENNYTDVSISVAKIDSLSKLYIGGFVGGNYGSQCNLTNCLVIADISAMSVEQLDEEAVDAWILRAKEVQLAERFSIGGIIGRLERTSYGINQCVYAAKDFGIRVAGLIEDTDATEEIKYPENHVSLTIGRNQADESKLVDVYAIADVLSFDFTAKVKTTDEEDKEVTTAVTDSSELSAILASIVNKNNILSTASTVLSDALQAILENRA